MTLDRETVTLVAAIAAALVGILSILNSNRNAKKTRLSLVHSKIADSRMERSDEIIRLASTIQAHQVFWGRDRAKGLVYNEMFILQEKVNLLRILIDPKDEDETQLFGSIHDYAQLVIDAGPQQADGNVLLDLTDKISRIANRIARNRANAVEEYLVEAVS